MNRNGDVYLQVRKAPGYGGGLRVVKSTQRRPYSLEEGCVLVKIRLQIPDAAFKPLEPVASVVVPEQLVQHPITVEAVDAST